MLDVLQVQLAGRYLSQKAGRTVATKIAPDRNAAFDEPVLFLDGTETLVIRETAAWERNRYGSGLYVVETWFSDGNGAIDDCQIGTADSWGGILGVAARAI